MTRGTSSTTVGNRVDERQADAPSIGFDEGLGAIEEAGGNGDHLASEVAVRDLVQGSVDAQGGVLVHAALGADHEGLAKDVGLYPHLCVALGEDGRGGPPEDARVWSCLVIAREPGVELLIDLRERRNVTEMVERLASERAPKALHFAPSLGIVRARVQQADAEPCAGCREHGAPIGRAVVEIEGIGPPVHRERVREERQHRLLALVVSDAQCDHVPRGVVEESVNANRDPLLAEDQRRSVADVAVPKRVGPLGLPAKTGAWTRAIRGRQARKRGSEAAASILRTVHSFNSEPARPSCCSVRTIMVTLTEGCSRRMSQSSSRKAGSRSRPLP